MIQKFIEIPNTIIREPVVNDFGYDLLYDMAQQYGHAQLLMILVMIYYMTWHNNMVMLN